MLVAVVSSGIRGSHSSCPVASAANLFLRASSVRARAPTSLRRRSKVSWRSKAMASAHPSQGLPSGMDPSMVDEYASQSKLLQEFVKIPSIGKAWIFTSKDENTSRAMVSVSQSDLLANKKRSFLLNTHISKSSSKSVSFQWSPFPVEMSGVSA
ncbi:hypothetical protein CFC21_008075, partial [Triticum aestivum]